MFVLFQSSFKIYLTVTSAAEKVTECGSNEGVFYGLASMQGGESVSSVYI